MNISVEEKDKKNGSTTEMAKQQVRSYAKRAEGEIDHATTKLGEGLARSADRVRDNAESFAQNLEGAGRYLKEAEVRNLGMRMTESVRRHPVAAIGIGAGLGFLLGRMISRR
ncbi:MAG: DUF883 C-terminal domain-containing protein [Myxococcota bacterium]